MQKVNKTQAFRVMGVDIGTAIVGWGVLDIADNDITVVDYGTITTLAHTPLPERLSHIYRDMETLCQQYQPQCAGVELLYFQSNQTTAMAVSQGRGVITLALQQNNVRIIDITPQQAKLAVSGYGRANKRQVQEMVKVILKLRDIPRPDDAADALALAITAARFALQPSVKI